MKCFSKHSLLIILFLSVFVGFGQPKNAIKINTSNVMSFFSERYGNEAKEIYTSRPEVIDEMIEFLTTNIYLVQNRKTPKHIKNKLSDYPIISKKSYRTEKFLPTKFNPFKYGLEQLTEKTIIYIDDTNYVVIVEPNK